MPTQPRTDAAQRVVPHDIVQRVGSRTGVIGEMHEREMQERSALISQLDTQRRQIADMQNQINALQRLLDESCMRRATSDVLRSNVSEWVWAWGGNSGNTWWGDRSDGNMPYHNGYHK